MWIVPVTIALLTIIILLMPKHLTWREIYITWGVIGFLAWAGDIFTGAVLDLYDIGPTKEVELIDFFATSMIPAEVAIIFLNFLPKGNRIWIYGIGWAFLTLLFEWFTTYTGFMETKGWKLWYSIFAWLFVYLFYLRWHLKYIRKE